MDRKTLRQNQLLGGITGIVIGLMTANFWPAIRAAVGGWVGAVMWGAALGAFLGSVPQLHLVGRVVTRSDNQLANFAVGLVAPFVLIAVLVLLLKLAV